MGGWNIIYGIINFALLAAGLYFLGKKSIVKKYNDYRNKIRDDLEQSKLQAENAPAVEEAAEKRLQGGDETCRKIIAEAERLSAEQAAEADALCAEEKKKIEDKAAEEYRQELTKLRWRLNRKAADRVAAGAARLLGEPEYEAARKKLADRFISGLAGRIRLSDADLARYERCGEIAVTCRTADALSGEQLSNIKSAVTEALNNAGEKTGGDSVRILNSVDEKILAGVYLRIDDSVYDGSGESVLKRFRSGIERDIAADIDRDFIESLRSALEHIDSGTEEYQVGTVESVSDGICHASGISDAMAGEMVEFKDGLSGMVMDLEQDSVGIVLLGSYEKLQAGDEVRRTGHILDVPVGPELMGRVVNALGEPVDGGGEIHTAERRPVESPAPGIIDRTPVSEPLETGIKAIDALVPIGKGQRELIIGDKQTGKTVIALDTILNQKGKNVICIYVAVGKKESTVAGFVEKLKEHDALSYTIVVMAGASESAPMLYLAPYAAAAMGEYFMYGGRDVLIVYDDLSKQAVAYREISLLLHRPPGREAYPGDVFYLHSRLLERAARLSPEAGGGSMTALPIIETQAGDISAYIPTNVISITDGQIFLETDLFNAGIRPAINVGLSVSRVGGSAQLGAVKQVSGRLRMDLAQYRELAAFSQFGSDLDKNTRSVLHRGDRMTEILKQDQYKPVDAEALVVAVFAANQGYMDDIELKKVSDFEEKLVKYVKINYPELEDIVNSGKKLSREQLAKLREVTAAFRAAY